VNAQAVSAAQKSRTRLGRRHCRNRHA